jgi:Tfp pilus assembly protein PilF
MPIRLLLGIGFSLILGPVHLAADADQWVNRQEPVLRPAAARSIGDQLVIGGVMIHETPPSSISPGLPLQFNLLQGEHRASGITIAQVSHRSPLNPMGIANRRPSPGIGFDTLPKARPGAPQGSSPPGILFAQEVPKEAQAQYDKARGLLKRENFDAGIQALDRALDIFPDYFLALQALGVVHIRQYHFEMALKTLAHAIEVNPKADISLVSMGIAQLNLGRVEECVRSLRQATTVNPRLPNAYLILGYALIRSGHPNEAEDPLQLAYRLGGDRVIESQLYLANAYEKNGRYHDAANALHLYLKHAPKGTHKQEIETMIAMLETKSAAANK